MKRWIALCLVIAMVLTMTACGCEHSAAKMSLTDIDTAKLTAKWNATCVDCGKVIEKRDASTGVAPQDGAFLLTPSQWFECLTTNIKAYDASGMLTPMPVESEDGAILRSVVSPSGFKSVISFFDKEENVLTADSTQPMHRIRVEAQFENDTATLFFTLVMPMAMTNNSQWDNNSLNALATQVMSGESVTDNGYTYTMEIISSITHTVVLHIEAV